MSKQSTNEQAQHYTVIQLAPEDAELEHIVKQAIKYRCAECDSCKHQVSTYDVYSLDTITMCKIYDTIRKPDEASIRKCPSFIPLDIEYTKRRIKIYTDKEEAEMRRFAEQAEKRHKEIFHSVRAMRVMARLVAHEVDKKLLRYNK